MPATLTRARPSAAYPPTVENPPALVGLPLCMKCRGDGTFVYSTPPRQGEIGRCTRCSTTRGRMTGDDIARYMAWSTRGYRDVDYRAILVATGPDGEEVRSARSIAANTLIYTYRGGEWVPLPERKIVPGAWVLIPKKQTKELMVVKVVDFFPVRSRR